MSGEPLQGEEQVSGKTLRAFLIGDSAYIPFTSMVSEAFPFLIISELPAKEIYVILGYLEQELG